MKPPWYRHTLGGQGRSADDVESLADALLILLTCCAAVAIYLLVRYL
jgi:hypothetical protein